MKTEEHFYLKDQVLALSTEKGYYLDIESLVSYLGLSYNNEISKITDFDELLEGVQDIELQYKNNKKDNKRCLALSKVPQYLFTLKAEDVRQELASDLKAFKLEAIRMINMKYMESSQLGSTQHARQEENLIHYQDRQKSLENEVENLQDQVKRQKAKYDYAVKQLEDGVSDPTTQSEMNTQKTDTRLALRELEPDLKDKKEKLKKVKQTLTTIKKENNPAKNMLDNLFASA